MAGALLALGGCHSSTKGGTIVGKWHAAWSAENGDHFGHYDLVLSSSGDFQEVHDGRIVSRQAHIVFEGAGAYQFSGNQLTLRYERNVVTSEVAGKPKRVSDLHARLVSQGREDTKNQFAELKGDVLITGPAKDSPDNLTMKRVL